MAQIHAAFSPPVVWSELAMIKIGNSHSSTQPANAPRFRAASIPKADAKHHARRICSRSPANSMLHTDIRRKFTREFIA